jgi:hypothetical protein
MPAARCGQPSLPGYQSEFRNLDFSVRVLKFIGNMLHFHPKLSLKDVGKGRFFRSDFAANMKVCSELKLYSERFSLELPAFPYSP